MKIEIESQQKTELIDITTKINNTLQNETGLCNIFVPHTTAAITINEPEERLLKDIKQTITTIIQEEQNYRHNDIDNNAASHLRQLLLNTNITIPVKNGELQLGTWQQILYIELDGPRKRKIQTTTIQSK